MQNLFKKLFNSKVTWVCYLPTLLCLNFAVEAKIYVFVSHSMNDSALQQYYKEAESLGATLIMRGLIDDSFTKNKEKAELLKIAYDINPELFDEYQITVVPVIVKHEKNVIQKITGHLPLREALKIFEDHE